MDKPKYEIWPVFEVFYVESMLFNAKSAMKSIGFVADVMQRVAAEDDVKPIEQCGRTNLLDHLQNIVLQGASLSRYFWPVGNSHKNRGRFLCKAFGLTDDSPLKSRDLRNAIEHFDERLDNYLKRNLVGYIFPEYVGYLPDDGGVPAHLFRAYFIDLGTFQLLDERYNIPIIAEEITRIFELLESCSANGRLPQPSET